MKDKGFTLVELLAAITILGILLFIGVVAITNVFDNSKVNYYKSMENTLSIAGNEYFNDNRDDKPIDDYNFVDIKTLENHNYIEELKTYDGKESCDSSSGVYIYNTDNGSGYEVCLICGDYKPKDGTYCGGTKYGTIHISGNINSANGPYYNPLLSYSGTSWINAGSIYIHFSYKSEGEQLNNYKIYNANTNTFFSDCNASQDGTCMLKMDTTGSYYVEGYNGSKKVANRKYFNIKLDNVKPKYEIKNTEKEILLDNEDILYTYENEIINVNDDNGYKEVTYTLTRYNPTKDKDTEYIAKDEDLISKDLKISHPLSSGKYDLYIYVKDFAGNEGVCTNSSSHITFYIRYNVGLEFYDNTDKKHNAGTIKVYTYGLYDKLPETVNVNGNSKETSWYRNTNFVAPIITKQTRVDKTGYHTLYGKEQRNTSSFNIKCDSNLTYNGEYQKLVKEIPTNEQGKYRLVVYYDGKLMENEAKDARTYLVIAILNSDYMWTDGTRTAKAISCEIRPKQVPKPACDDKVYNGKEQKIVKNVDDNGNHYGFKGEKAYSLDKKPFATNAGEYDFTASFHSLNYAWEGVSSNIYGSVGLRCKINKKPVSKPGSPCVSGLVFNGQNQYVIKTDGLTNIGGSGYFSQLPAGSGDIEYIDEFSVVYTVQNRIDGVQAGRYRNSFILGSNYCWSDGSTNAIVFTCTISSKTVSWPGPNEIEYCGEPSSCETLIGDIGPTYSDYLGLKPMIAAKMDTLDKKNNKYKAKLTFYEGGSSTGKSEYGYDMYTPEDYGLTPLPDLVISPSTVDIAIKDSKAPECDTAKVDSSGLITFTATDNYKFANGKTTDSKTVQADKTDTYKTTFKDAFDNPSEECTLSVTKVLQKRTATCSTGKRCSDAGCQTRNYCYDSSCGCKEFSDWSSASGCKETFGGNDDYHSCDECVNGKYTCKTRTCNKYKYCQSSNCTCATYYESIDKCGCDTWGNYSNWEDVTECTSSTTNSSKVECRTIYR